MPQSFMFPHVTLKQDLNLDIQMTINFLNWKMEGMDFTENIFGPHPELKEVDVNNEEARCR